MCSLHRSKQRKFFMYKKQKRHVTLIEMMIVMFLIAMIIGVVAYNYQGSLEEGRAFKTKAGKEKLETILTLAADGAPDENIERGWRDIIKKSPLVSNAKDLMNDGWGKEFEVHVKEGKIDITSRKFTEYTQKHPDSKFREEKKDNS